MVAREKKDRPYAVVPYDPAWKQGYEQERDALTRLFQQKAVRIEHIGSTSVEGLWAKPQIDILVLVRHLSDVDALREQIIASGYAFQGDFATERYLVRDAQSGERLVSIHIKEEQSPDALDQVRFRDYLRAHPEARERYSQAKRKAYESGVDRVQYSKEKHDLLLDLLRRAKKWSA
jgi:GrpB-like predicted nucleotidyltransferase (UPF0157 family)